MKINIVMPQMGESITEGTIIKWHKKKGDKVKKDEIIYEISTDKVDTEIPSPQDGILAEIKVFEQETVPVNSVVAVLETDASAAEAEPVQAPQASTTQVGGSIIEVPMPKMGESVMEGTIIKWHKKPGDAVKADEIIFEISTDKVDTEVPSPAGGILEEILCAEQQTVPVGFVVAKIRSATGLRKVEPVIAPPVQQGAAAAKEEPKPEIITPVKSVKIQSGRFYSPLVMNIAGKEKIPFEELETIAGTGLNGRLTKKDILEYLDKKKAGHVPQKAFAETVSAGVTKPITGNGTEIIPMDNTRRMIMQHMVKSRDTSVHVTAILEVDMTKIHNFIEKNRESFLKERDVKLTYMPFISYAVIKALREFPLMNASVDGSNILQKKYINLGIAVAVEPNGLIVPNIKNADEKNITGLAKAIAEIGFKARNKKLLPEDVSDGTFSITNYGVFGSLFGTPIINQPEVGILGVGAVTKKPVVVEIEGNDVIAIKPMMYLSLSHDHRLVDGMLGGRFLKSVKDSLENFDVSIV